MVRKARIDDLGAITEIYNHAVVNTAATLDIEQKTVEEQRIWFEEHGARAPILVAEEDGRVVAWASLSQWSRRGGYSDTAEVSVYVREGYRGKGIGRNLTKKILEAGKDAGLHAVIARITEGSETSIRLFESLGFTHVGVMREVGRKFGKLLDVRVMQKILSTPRK
ncbi:GCN5 family acetyltransferase [candidate division TA06 bacterium DG_26]|uniref:GCN5 family acetyltransferase n=1 Tax=candidate division TA06 bacterium DG_26 TaxID=1703771 RepID=A0A0S7WGH0_UNCT6|nr:MAG: GCN5 family acetyltransferase [candidate division TA06 bacterium DG_26]